MTLNHRLYRALAFSVFALLTLPTGTLFGQTPPSPPTITNIAPQSPTAAGKSFTVNITGSGFFTSGQAAKDLKLAFDESFITADNLTATSDTAMTAVFKLTQTASGKVNVTISANSQHSAAFSWDTNIAVNECIEAINADGCALRWEVDATGISGSGTNTSTATGSNILVKLDYQFRHNNDTKQKNLDRLKAAGLKLHAMDSSVPTGNLTDFLKPYSAQSGASPTLLRASVAFAKAQANEAKTDNDNSGAKAGDRFGLHVVFSTGYTQVATAAKLQPVSSGSSGSQTNSGNGSSGTTPQCTPSSASSGSSSGSSSSSAVCSAATPQQAFVADASLHGGWTFHQDGSGGTFAEIGFGARGAIQDLVQSNQLIQNNGASYLQLTSLNSRNVIGLYEGVARFRLASHDAGAIKGGSYSNTPDLVLVEGGFQYNSGMQQLAPNPLTNTRNRLVARFYLFPELSSTNHTKAQIGLEFSGGINGGPKTIQIVWGTNLNPSRLFNPSE